MNTECIFCRILRHEIPAERLYEDAQVIVIADIRPQAPVHLLAIPRTHCTAFTDSAEGAEVMKQLAFAVTHVVHAQGLHQKGYRLVINAGTDAGQEVPHLHAHILAGRTFSWPPG